MIRVFLFTATDYLILIDARWIQQRARGRFEFNPLSARLQNPGRQAENVSPFLCPLTVIPLDKQRMKKDQLRMNRG